MKTNKINNGMTRCHFNGITATAATAFTIVPSNVIAGLGHRVQTDNAV